MAGATALTPPFAPAHGHWMPRRRKTAAERRQQTARAELRTVSRFLMGAKFTHGHRGCRMPLIASAIELALRGSTASAPHEEKSQSPDTGADVERGGLPLLLRPAGEHGLVPGFDVDFDFEHDFDVERLPASVGPGMVDLHGISQDFASYPADAGGGGSPPSASAVVRFSPEPPEIVFFSVDSMGGRASSGCPLGDGASDAASAVDGPASPALSQEFLRDVFQGVVDTVAEALLVAFKEMRGSFPVWPPFEGVPEEDSVARITQHVSDRASKLLQDAEQVLLSEYPFLSAFSDDVKEEAFEHFNGIILQGLAQWKSFALARSSASPPGPPPGELRVRPFKLRMVAATGRPSGLSSVPGFGAGPRRSKGKRK